MFFFCFVVLFFASSMGSAFHVPAPPARRSSALFAEGAKVKMFGAQLDAGLAGVKAVSRQKIMQVLGDDQATLNISATDRAEIFYAEAVDVMNKGQYAKAVDLLNRAVSFSGPRTRRGGQMQLWLAQALHASNQDGQALKLMTILESHPVSDVRKVATELNFILKAPRIKLTKSDFVTFDERNFQDDTPYQRDPDGKIRKRQKSTYKEPEYYSDEWLKRRGPMEPVDLDPGFFLAASALCIGGLLVFAS